MLFSDELADLYRRDLTRLIQELQAFPSEPEIWKTLPGVANSAGHLALHLEGNLREYIGRQLGGVDYQRNRPEEFASMGVPREQLIERLEGVRELVSGVVRSLTVERLEAAFPEKMFGALLPTRQLVIHLLAHLNYHLGQVDYLRRCLSGDGAIELASL